MSIFKNGGRFSDKFKGEYRGVLISQLLPQLQRREFQKESC